MIQGLQVDVKSDELKAIIEERFKHHTDRSEVYAKKAEELKKSIAGLEEDLAVSKVSNGSAADGLEGKSREHKDKATYYKFLLDHVIQNDVYRLGQEDLKRLGISTHYY